MANKDRKAPSTYFPVILEIGNLLIRAGFANDAVPICTHEVNDPLFEYIINRSNVSSISIPSYLLNDISYTSDEYTYNQEKKCVEIDVKSDILRQYQYDIVHLKYLFNNDIAVDLYTDEHFERFLLKILSYIFENDLLVDPTTCKVTIPVQLLCPIHIRRRICNVLLKDIGVQSVSFFPSPLLSVIGSGAETGLVVDLGWDSTIISPVCFNTLLHMKCKIIRKCSRKNIHYKMLRSLKNYIKEGINSNGDIDTESFKNEIFLFIENIIDECSYVRPRGLVEESRSREKITNNYTDWFNYRDKLRFPNKLRYQAIEKVFFSKKEDGETGELSLIDGILQTIGDCDVFLRNKLSSNILFTGDMCCIPGLKSRILQELRSTDSSLSFSANISLGNWAGASIFTSKNSMKNGKALSTYETSKEQYLLSSSLSSDWLDKFFRHMEFKDKGL